LSQIRPLSFVALTQAFVQPNYGLFAAQAVSFLNGGNAAVSRRKITIYPKPLSRIVGENRSMIELVFKGGSEDLRTEKLRTPLALAEGLSRKGIKEVILRPGVAREDLELFLHQVCQPKDSVRKVRSIEVYTTLFEPNMYVELAQKLVAILNETPGEKCSIVLSAQPLRGKDLDTYSLKIELFDSKGEILVKPWREKIFSNQPDALAERMAARNYQNLTFESYHKLEDIEDMILQIIREPGEEPDIIF
jgi:hypothetical protein